MRKNIKLITENSPLFVHRQHCILCGGTEHTLVQPHLEFPNTKILSCETCNLLFTNPVPTTEYLNSIYAQSRWNGKDIDISASLPASQARFVQQMVGPRLPSHGKVLDIGCNAGNLLNIFQHQGWDVFGIEPNDGAASYARDKFNINVKTGTLSSVTFHAQEFDLVSMSHVLEHLEDPLTDLQRVRKILKTDGYLFIEVPNEGWGRCYGTTGYHLFFFTPETLNQLLQKAGFQPVKLVTSGRLLAEYQRLSSIKYSQLGKKLYNIPFIVRLFRYFIGGLSTENDQLDNMYPTEGNRMGAAIRGIFKPYTEDS